MELRDFLHFERMTIKELSKKIGCTAIYLGNVVNGKMIPGRELAMKIEEETKGKVTAVEVLKLYPKKD